MFLIYGDLYSASEGDHNHCLDLSPRAFDLNFLPLNSDRKIYSLSFIHHWVFILYHLFIIEYFILYHLFIIKYFILYHLFIIKYFILYHLFIRVFYFLPFIHYFTIYSLLSFFSLPFIHHWVFYSLPFIHHHWVFILHHLFICIFFKCKTKLEILCALCSILNRKFISRNYKW